MTPGWAFLVARGFEIGYQVLLAPDFLLDGPAAGLLLSEVRGEVPDAGPPQMATVAAPWGGVAAIVHRTTRLTRGDVGETDRPDASLTDRAGRALVLAYGFVCRDAQVIAPEAQDLQAAREQAVATYRRFWAAGEDFRPETSSAYPVRSGMVPVDVVPATAPSVMATPAWNADPLAGVEAAPDRRPPIRILLGLLAAICLIAVLGLGAFAALTTTVPDVRGQASTDAQREIVDAGLRVKLNTVPDSKPRGTVIKTEPEKGQRLRNNAVVTITVSDGTG